MRNMDEKELRMRAFCHTWKGRFVTFVEWSAFGALIFCFLIDYLVSHDATFRGNEANLIDALSTVACVFWGLICAFLCSGGGAPSIFFHRLFYVSPGDIERYQKWRKAP